MSLNAIPEMDQLALETEAPFAILQAQFFKPGAT